MYSKIISFLEMLSGFLWSVPLPLIIVTAGVFLSIKSRFFQIRNLKSSLKAPFKEQSRENEISPFAAACTALSATIGTGNIAGVAGAVALGGAGAVFWMWVTSFLGMIIKVAETFLAIKYRKSTEDGYAGGPMYYIGHGMPKIFRPLAAAFSLFGIFAAFGSGNAVQVNTAVCTATDLLTALSPQALFTVKVILGVVIALLIGAVLLGGTVRISKAAEALVPAMVVLYMGLTLGVIVICIDKLPQAIYSIFVGAFSPRAVTGGAVGSFFIAFQKGLSRGIFSNEAGMGTSAMAHACVTESNPVNQGLFGIFEVFVDSILICTATALAILCSGANIPYGTDAGVALTVSAFSEVYGRFSAPLLAVPIFFFAFGSIIGWGLYGIRCTEYVFGRRSVKPFLFCFCASSVLGAVTTPEAMWLLSDVCNGLMALPNMVAVIWLSPQVLKEVK